MLFAKKDKFGITESNIKKEFKDESGRCVLKINLRFPVLSCPKKHPLLLNAAPFYNAMSEGLAEYANDELFKLAKTAFAASEGDILPFSLVTQWEKSFEDEKYLSIITDISVGDGISSPRTERKTQVWSKTNGNKCRFADIVGKEAAKRFIKSNIAKEHGRFFDSGLFALDNGIPVFFIKKGEDYEKLFYIPDEGTA